MSAVQDFYTNKVMRDDVKRYFDAQLEKEAVEKVFKREDVSHIAEAKALLDRIFENMSADFKTVKAIDTSNPAR